MDVENGCGLPAIWTVGCRATTRIPNASATRTTAAAIVPIHAPKLMPKYTGEPPKNDDSELITAPETRAIVVDTNRPAKIAPPSSVTNHSTRERVATSGASTVFQLAKRASTVI